MNICICIGAPKCSTTHLSRIFKESDNFTILDKDGFGECGKLFFEIEDNNNYFFGKQPGWIFNKHIIKNIVEKLKKNNNNSLIIVCLREYNELLYSFWLHRKKENEINKDMKYIDFLKLKSEENQTLTYEECVLSIEDNIIYLINLLKDIKKIKLLIYDHSFIIKNNMVEELKNQGLDIKYDNYIFKPFKYRYEYDKKLYNEVIHTKYNNLINNQYIKTYLRI